MSLKFWISRYQLYSTFNYLYIIHYRFFHVYIQDSLISALIFLLKLVSLSFCKLAMYFDSVADNITRLRLCILHLIGVSASSFCDIYFAIWKFMMCNEKLR